MQHEVTPHYQMKDNLSIKIILITNYNPLNNTGNLLNLNLWRVRPSNLGFN